MERGANPNLRNAKGVTALFPAAYKGEIEVIKELLKHGADPYFGEDNGWSLIDILRSCHRDSIIEFISQSYDPSIIDPETGILNLTIIVVNAPLSIVRMLIDANPDLDLNQQDREGNTPLIYAVVNKQKEHVDLLLDRGADPNLSNNGGGTPLAYAIDSNQPEIEQMLIDAGAR